MAMWKLRFARGRAEAAENRGRHWYVKRNYDWLWLIVYSAVGMAILSAALFLFGTTGK
jgi:hypothetical protein